MTRLGRVAISPVGRMPSFSNTRREPKFSGRHSAMMRYRGSADRKRVTTAPDASLAWSWSWQALAIQ